MSVGNKLLQAAAGNAGGDPVYVDDVFSTFLYEGTGLPHTIANGINLGSLNVNAFGYGDDGTSRTIALNHLAEGDVVVVFNTGAATGATVTVGGNSVTVLEQDYTSPTYAYEHSTFAYTVASGDPAIMDVVITNNTYGGLVLVIKGGATVTLQAGGSANSANTITEPDFSTTGYGLILTSDRDPGATSLTTTDADLRNLIIDDSSPYFVHSCWEMDSGNGGTISGFNDGSNFEQVHVVLKVEGAGTTAFGNTEADGGLVWTKRRSSTASHYLHDTERGATKNLLSNNSNAEGTLSNGIVSFSATGYVVGSADKYNGSSNDYVSWTFRKAEKFFDIVTWTGDGNSSQTISHNLGSTPGMMIMRRTNDTGNWIVRHRGLSSGTRYLMLNSTNADASYSFDWNPTDTTFTAHKLGGADYSSNTSGDTYIAYLFAHDEQDFGEDSDEAIIKCDSFTTDSSGNGSVDLGFEPQWILIKKTNSTGSWGIMDSMRGFTFEDTNKFLFAHTSDAETDNSLWDIRNNGFNLNSGGNTQTFIYMAIRRPNKPASELSARELFAIDTKGGTKPNPPLFTFGLPVDMAFNKNVNGTGSWRNVARLMQGKNLVPNSTNAQASDGSLGAFDYQNGWRDGTTVTATAYAWMWRRAKGYFDVVLYEGTGSNRTVSHNLGVKPELMIIKDKSSTNHWAIYNSVSGATKYMHFNTSALATSSTYFNDTEPTSSVFTVGTQSRTNANTDTFIAYLFASVDGISKIGSFTKVSGYDYDVDCGFSSGARLVIIKRTDSTSPWYVFDSVRGINAASTDPYVQLNTNAAQVTNANIVNPLSSGFTAVGGLTAGDYIFLAIA